MTPVIRACQKCGTEIPADAPEGGCPGCLLETALYASGDLDESGITELTFKDRHKAGRESRQPIEYRATVRFKTALARSGLTNLVT